MTFSEIIRQLRGTQTMDAFGKRINTKPTTISSWENSDVIPSANKLIAIAKILNVSVDYLLGLSENKLRSLTTKRIDKSQMSCSKLDIAPTAILSNNHDDLIYTDDPVNTLAFVKSQSEFNRMYLSPLVELIMTSKTKSAIVMDVDNNQLMHDLLDLSEQNNYSPVIVGTPLKLSTNTFKWNLLEFLRTSSESTIMSIFRQMVFNGTKNIQIVDSYLQLASVHYLFVLFVAYREYMDDATKMSFQSFYDFADTTLFSDLDIKRSSLLSSLDKSETVKTKMVWTILSLLSDYNEDEFVSHMDESYTNTLPLINDNSIILFDFRYESLIERAYSSMIKQALVDNMLSTPHEHSTHWFMNLIAHGFDYERSLDMSHAYKQYWTIITDNLFDKKLINHANIVMNQYPLDKKIYDILNDTIEFSGHINDITTVPYVLTHDNAYIYSDDEQFIANVYDTNSEPTPMLDLLMPADESDLSDQELADLNSNTDLIRNILLGIIRQYRD